MKRVKVFLVVLFLVSFLPAFTMAETQISSGDNNQANVILKNQPEKKVIGQDRYVTLKNPKIKVHYKIIGDGPVTAVFIPGWTNPLEVYTMQFEYFKDKAKCIYIDPPGQGRSDATEGVDYTMELMADAMYVVVKKEKIKQFVGVGFSMGPTVIAQFYRKHPEMMSGVVNLDGGFAPWPTEEPARQKYIDEQEAFLKQVENWGETEKEGFGTQVMSPDTPEELKELVQYFYVYPSWLMANILRNASKEEVNIPPDWNIPALCIFTHPVDNNVVNSLFPGAEIHIFEGSGHVVQWERHEQVNPILWDFIQKL